MGKRTVECMVRKESGGYRGRGERMRTRSVGDRGRACFSRTTRWVVTAMF